MKLFKVDTRYEGMHDVKADGVEERSGTLLFYDHKGFGRRNFHTFYGHDTWLVVKEVQE